MRLEEIKNYMTKQEFALAKDKVSTMEEGETMEFENIKVEKNNYNIYKIYSKTKLKEIGVINNNKIKPINPNLF